MDRIERIKEDLDDNFLLSPEDGRFLLSQLEQATGLLKRSKPFIQYAKEYNYAGDVLDTEIAAFLNQK